MYKNNLRILMAEKFINITELSKETGISRNSLTKLYHEKSNTIQFKTLTKLCNFFDCTPSELIVISKELKQ